MAGPIYKFWMSRLTEAWYSLSEEEQNTLVAKTQGALENIGGKTIIMATPAWSAEKWMLCGVEEFPDIEAVQEHTQRLFELGHYRYMECTSMLATEWPPS